MLFSFHLLSYHDTLVEARFPRVCMHEREGVLDLVILGWM